MMEAAAMVHPIATRFAKIYGIRHSYTFNTLLSVTRREKNTHVSLPLSPSLSRQRKVKRIIVAQYYICEIPIKIPI